MVLFLTLYRLILRNIPSFYKMGRDLWTGFYSAFCQFLSDSDTFVMTNMIYWELVIIEIVKGFLLMSVFSDMLKNYIHEKDVKVGALAHYCQLERSTIYKFINGKREPMSAELVEQIAYFIKLTPLETHQLRESWKMARMGEDAYYIRKSVEHFLCDFPNKSTPPSCDFTPPHANLVKRLSPTQNCLLLNSRQAIDSSVHQILLSEAAKPNGKIALFLQPDYPFLLHLLSTIQPAGSLQIDHIFSLNRTAQFTDAHELYELYYLRNLFPVYMNKLDYRIHCFYTNEISHLQNLSALPYMILTSEFAITCSSDYQTGILYQDPDILQALWNLFHSHRDLCQPAFQTFPIIADDLPSLFQFVARTRASADLLINIQPEACILPFLRRDLLEDIFNYDIPGADSVISMADTLFNNNMQLINDEKFIIYFTEYGMTRFLQEGLFEEIPQTFYHPLNIAQRIRILREIAQCCHNGSYRILKKPLNHLSENLRMCLCGNTCSLTYQTNSGDHMCFAITEPFILQIFQEFLTNMDPDVYYKSEEAEQIIYRMIEQLEAK